MKSFKRLISTAIAVFLLFSAAFSMSAGKQKRQFRRAAGCPSNSAAQPIMVAITGPADSVMHFSYFMPMPTIKTTGLHYAATDLYEIDLGNSFQNGSEGQPVLPVIPAQFVLPSGCSLADVKVIATVKKDIKGVYRVRHGEANIALKPGAKPRTAVPDKKIYDSDNDFPNKIVEITGVYRKCGVSIAVVKIHPAVYRPRSGRLSYFQSVDLDVSVKKGSAPTRIKTRMDKNSAVMLKVENPEALGASMQGPITPLDSGPSMALGGLCDTVFRYRYVLVTADSIKNAATDYTVRDLIARKQADGISATIVTMESILTGYPGVDNAEKLRNFIIDAYNKWETGDVLLCGDATIIPIRKLWCMGEGDVEQIPSDLYYQCLDGNYNSDGDSLWGEPNDGPGGTDVDLMAEVNVGRAMAGNCREMANFVYKTLAYENAPESSPFLRKALMAGEFLGFGGAAQYATAAMEEIRLGSGAHGYTTAGFAASPLFSVDTLYDAPTFMWLPGDMKARMSSGAYGVYNHLGHADETYDLRLNNGDAEALTNSNYFFVYSQGCDAGALDADCFARHLTVSTRHGAFAAVFNSRYGWGQYNSTDGPSQRFNRQFWDAYFGQSKTDLGALNAAGHENNIWDINRDCIRWCLYETNLLGDPQASLRGKSTGPSMAFNAYTFSDGSGGNGDYVINPGESIDLVLSVANVGADSATGVSCVVSTSDSYITVVNGAAAFGNVACCGSIKQAFNPVSLRISSSCPAPYTALLSFRITDVRDSSWTSAFSITVYSSSQISGFVRTLTGSNPIGGASVTYSGPLSGSVTADSSGRYMFGGIEGTYAIVAGRKDYAFSDTQKAVIPPSRTEVNFYLKESAHIAVSPLAFHESLLQGDSSFQTLRIVNTGGVELHYAISPENAGNNPLGAKKILIIGDGGTEVGLDSLFKNAGYVTTIVGDDSVYNGANPGPSGYSAIVLTDGNNSGNDMPIGGQNALMDFVRGGGGLITTEWIAYEIQNNRYSILRSIIPLTRTGGSSGTETYRVAANHPITSGVDSLFNVSTGTSIGTANSGNVVVTGAVAGAGVVAMQAGKGKVVSFASAGKYGPYNAFADKNMQKLMLNAVAWVGGKAVRWLSIDSDTGSVPPDSAREIHVTFQSADVFGGNYYAQLSLAHDAPGVVSPITVPCTLHVIGMSRLSASPAKPSFGPVWVGAQKSIPVTLTNSGTDTTVVTSLEGTSARFAFSEAAPLHIAPQTSTVVQLTYGPTGLVNDTDTLTIRSGAADNPVILMVSTGQGTSGPRIAVTPTSVRHLMGPGDSATDTISIVNSGGDKCAYSISAYPNSPYPWLTSVALGGIVAPGRAAQAPILMNARQMPAGVYCGRVDILHNAPGQPKASVACTLIVVGTKRLSVQPMVVNFGTLYIGRDSLVSISLKNAGNDTTTISGISSNAADFSFAGTTPIKAPPYSVRTIQLRFAPSNASAETVIVTITGNADDNPSIPLSAHGIGVYPPVMNVSPFAFNDTVGLEGLKTETVVIANTGGSPLTIGIEAKTSAQGTPAALGFGLPDAFGYRWKDSDAPGGPVFAWRDIKSIGVMMPKVSSCDECFEARPISFAFPFYGAAYSALYVSSNGFITFGAGSNTIANYPLPSSYAPPNLIDILHDDLNPGSAGDVYFLDEGDKVTVQYDNVRAFNGSGNYTCQAVLKSDGTMTLYYATLTGTLTGCTVGIQNATRDIGLTVVYNAPYLKNNLAIEISKPPTWFTISPDQATILPGTSMNATVTFNARGLERSIFRGAIEISHNDPAQAQPYIIPCSLTITEETFPPGHSRIVAIGPSALPSALGSFYKTNDIKIGFPIIGRARGLRYSVILK